MKELIDNIKLALVCQKKGVEVNSLRYWNWDEIEFILMEYLKPFTEHSDPAMDAMYCSDPSVCKKLNEIEALIQWDSKNYGFIKWWAHGQILDEDKPIDPCDCHREETPPCQGCVARMLEEKLNRVLMVIRRK